MATITKGDSVPDELKLWRYMSIDKLINILDTETLFFSPLSNFAKTDPFEGYLPKVAFKSLSSILGSQYQDIEVAYEQLKKKSDEAVMLGHPNATGDNKLQELRIKIDSQNENIKEIYKKISKGIAVNCWHGNRSESEAMWKMYSDNGKGIAIQTSVSSLMKSIGSIDQDIHIHMGSVKYLDFYDENILPKDCVVDGHLSPLLKRSSFSHENEIRLFISPQIEYQDMGNCNAQSKRIKIDIKTLVEKIYISPYSDELFISSIKAVVKKYNFPEELIIASNLLRGHDDLLDILGRW